MTDARNSVTSQTGTTLGRRQFLQVTAIAGAGFLIGCGSREQAATPSVGAMPAPADADLNAFVKIMADDSVTVVIKHLDKGQGVTTGLTTIVAEELDAAWSQMRWEFAPANADLYNNLAFGPIQGTGGSSSIANSWSQLRNAAAAARAMLVAAAAQLWAVPAGEVTVSEGRVIHAGSNRSSGFGALASTAAGIAPPQQPTLKDPANFRLVGRHVPRIDSASKSEGTARFTIDVARPGMLMAVVEHPPRFGATVAAFDGTDALAVPGVREVIQIPRGVAVLADSHWAALQGRKALKVQWDDGNAERRGTTVLREQYRALMDKPGMEVHKQGELDTALKSAAKTVTADYAFPYLAHATMEPMNCLVELGPDRCEIWTGSQIPTLDQGVAAGIAGIKPEQVIIHTQYAGGSFGRRAVPDSDYVAEAVMIARAIEGSAAVKLQWTREDDMRAGRYRPMSWHRLSAGIDSDGKPVAWSHRIAAQSITNGTPFGGPPGSLDSSIAEGAAELPYTIANQRVDVHQPEVGVPVLWWRSVGHSQNACAKECFLDEVATLAGRDPYAFRRELLADHPRLLGVLDLAAKSAGWDVAPGEGRGRGIAVHESFNSFVAEVVDVSRDADGRFSIDRVVCAVDCGIAVNPDIVKAQMEGGIAYGLSAVLRESVTLEDGKVREDNFDKYEALRINEMPTVEVHIVASGEAPSGVGEPGLPPLAPALLNAIAAAGGPRIRDLPIGDKITFA